MPFSERLPGFRELLSLCDQFQDQSLPQPTKSFQIADDKRRIRVTRLNSRPYSSSSIRNIGGVRSRKRKDTFDREEQRKAKLENDPWSDKTRLTPKSVFCLGCERFIRLDRRNDYYPGLWLKHRELCHGIARAKKEANERQNLENESSEQKKYSKPSIDDEQAALILVEMMVKSRCFSDSDSCSSSSN
ncbi:hypothetical protein L218DRAFT_1072377 [Marasmius fiardii PR-910]|nr:hypothetical protein L218DRAFT_1072377 [Marasmius fiardii PR-910]